VNQTTHNHEDDCTKVHESLDLVLIEWVCGGVWVFVVTPIALPLVVCSRPVLR
jgi:hypothetical protein